MVAASRAKKNRLGILIFTAAILGLLSTTGMVDAQSFSTPKDAPVHVWGYVTDEQGAPIPGVLVCTFGEYGDYWRRDLHIFEVNYTDGDGWFELEFASSWNIYMTVLGDNASTPGLDWFPYNVDLDYGFIGEHNVTLRPGATLDVVGQYRSVDIEIRKWDNYRVVDAKNEAIIYYNRHNKVVPNYVFEFITYDLLEFNSSMVAAPADTECYLWYGLRNILNVTDGPLLLHQGQVMTIDIEEYCLQLDLEKIEEKRALAWEKIVEAESYGFYTAQERLDYRKTGDAKQYADNYSKMEFEQIFVEVKNAYLLASGIVTRIDNNYTEAAFSINVITFFIALSSLLLSGVITPNRKTQLISSVILFVIQFGFFSLVYPGSRLIPFSQIIVNCLVSIIGAPIVDRILRLILKRRRGDLGFYDTITATYVIAVRNLKRRRLRSVITGTTLVTMTMGFVALTSLSANYGLVQGKEQLTYASVDGVLMRMHEYESHYGPTDPDYTTDIGNFNPVDEKTQGWLLSNSQVKGLALKAEKQAEHSLPMIGLDPISDPLMTPIDEITTIGEKLRELGTCLVHEARLGKTEKGEYIKILAEDGKTEEYITVYDVDDYIYGLKVVGGFSKEIDKVRDIDGKTILPKTQIDIMSKHKRAQYYNPKRLIITTLEDAYGRGLSISRVCIFTDEGINPSLLVQSLALSSEYRFWWAHDGVIDYKAMGAVIEGKGFSLIVPWGIVVLTVIATMLASMYERKREIDILSSVGLNPGHIAGVFLSESLVLGVTSGCLGYLLGLGVYPVLSHLSFAPAVQQKISAVWSLGAIGISIISVIVGTLLALRSSVALTPSMKMKWGIRKEDKTGEFSNSYRLDMPVLISEEKVTAFTDFLETNIRRRILSLGSDLSYSVNTPTYIRRGRNEEQTSLVMIHRGGTKFDVSKTEMKIEKMDEGLYGLVLISVGPVNSVKQVGDLVRRILMEWSHHTGQIHEEMKHLDLTG